MLKIEIEHREPRSIVIPAKAGVRASDGAFALGFPLLRE
jgi:hypothetical protein